MFPRFALIAVLFGAFLPLLGCQDKGGQVELTPRESITPEEESNMNAMEQSMSETANQH